MWRPSHRVRDPNTSRSIDRRTRMRRICVFVPAVGPTSAPALAASDNPHPRRAAQRDPTGDQLRTARTRERQARRSTLAGLNS
jgi:hypothetical protein